MENKNNGVLIGIIVVLLLAVVGLSGFIIYDKVLKSNNDQNNGVGETLDDNTNNSEEENNNVENEGSSCVVGTYYGEYSGNSSVNSFLIYDIKTKYTFNSDGTYTADFSGVSGEIGTYTLNDGILTITYLPEVGTGETVTETLDLSDDCSYITITGTDYTYNLNKQ